MRGRKPKPTGLAILHGNPSKLNKTQIEGRAAMEPTGDLLDVPDYFSDAQATIWRNAVANAPPGILRTIDSWALVAWVVACDLHRQATIAQGKTSLLIRPTATPSPPRRGEKAAPPSQSFPQQSPLLAIINRQAIIMLRAAEQMGFTPISRPRIFGSSPSPSAPAPRDAPASAYMSIDNYLASAPAKPTAH
jgi:phage terminase small subunit